MLYVPLAQFRYDNYGNRSPSGKVHAFPRGQIYKPIITNSDVIQSACGLYEFVFGDWAWEVPKEQEEDITEVCEICERAFLLDELGE